MNKTLQQLDPNTDNWTTLAEFELLGDGVRATYHDPITRAMIEDDGIYIGGKTLYPVDGKDFLNALAPAFSRSSYLRVIDHDKGSTGG